MLLALETLFPTWVLVPSLPNLITHPMLLSMPKNNMNIVHGNHLLPIIQKSCAKNVGGSGSTVMKSCPSWASCHFSTSNPVTTPKSSVTTKNQTQTNYESHLGTNKFKIHLRGWFLMPQHCHEIWPLLGLQPLLHFQPCTHTQKQRHHKKSNTNQLQRPFRNK